MTTAINLRPSIAPGLNGGGKQAGAAPDGSVFSALLALAGTADSAGEPAKGPAAIALASLNSTSSGGEGEGASNALLDVFGALIGRLENLAAALDENAPLDQATLGPLAALIESLTDLLDPETGETPDAAALDALAKLANELGLENADLGTGTGPLDALAALATELAGQLREDVPELSGRLTDLARALDTHSARLEALANAAPPDADMRRKLAESENKLDPNAAIKGNTENEARPGLRMGAKATPDTPARPLPPLEARQQPEPGPQPAPERPSTTANANAPAQPILAGMGAEAGKGADLPDGLSFTPSQSATAPAAGAKPVTNAAYVRPDPQVNLPHVAVEIARHVQNGVNRFEIRLNPPELGRIDVRLEMDQSGNVMARLAVERSETLDLLQRDQRMLEKALAEAGLDGEKTDLEFSLKQDGAGSEGEDDPWNNGSSAQAETSETVNALAPDQPYRGYARLDAVNLWV